MNTFLKLSLASAIPASLAFSAVTKSTFLRTSTFSKSFSNTAVTTLTMSSQLSIPDQTERFGKAKKEDNQRFLNIESVYEPGYIKGKRFAVTGANRGVGLGLATEITKQGGKVVALVRSSNDDLEKLKPDEIITDMDVTFDDLTERVSSQVKGGPIDVLINCAGHRTGKTETIDEPDFKGLMEQIDVNSIGPLRVTSAFYKCGLLKEGSTVAIIASQDASIGWRTVQSPDGGDYGYLMSKAAANMVGVLLAQELKSKKIAVFSLHPGFNKTAMTASIPDEMKEKGGAVDPSVGAKRILHVVGKIDMSTAGKFINVEDGLEIPW